MRHEASGPAASEPGPEPLPAAVAWEARIEAALGRAQPLVVCAVLGVLLLATWHPLGLLGRGFVTDLGLLVYRTRGSIPLGAVPPSVVALILTVLAGQTLLLVWTCHAAVEGLRAKGRLPWVPTVLFTLGLLFLRGVLPAAALAFVGVVVLYGYLELLMSIGGGTPGAVSGRDGVHGPSGSRR